MEEFLFLNLTFIVETTDEMLNKIRRTKVRAKDDEAKGRGFHPTFALIPGVF